MTATSATGLCLLLLLAGCSTDEPGHVSLPPAGAGGLSNGAGAMAGADSGTAGGPGSAATGGGGGNSGSSATGGSEAGAAGASAQAGAGGSSQSHCKRGLGVNDASSEDLQALAPGASWFYDWGLTAPSGVGESAEALALEFVPMLWGGDPDVDATLASMPAGAGYLLAFNEPNFHAQANISAADAAARWPAIEQIADAAGLEIVGPAVNSCGPETECWDTDPISYLDEFFAACEGCRVDHVAIHWYACDVPGLEWYLGEAKKYGKPLWLTEFNCPAGDANAQLAYMQAALPVLEADPQVFRYAWFMARSTATEINLLAGSGELTALGQEYVTAAVASDCAR